MDDNNNNPSTSSSHQWRESEEKLLVQTRASMENQFNLNKSHTVLWGRIVEELRVKEVNVSIQQAKDKWKNLKKRYNEVIDLNRKTGNEKSTCRHYEVLNELYGDKANTKAHFTIDTD